MDIDTATKLAEISGDPIADLAAFMVRAAKAEAAAEEADNKRYKLGMECERLQGQVELLQESVAEWSAAAAGHVDTIAKMQADYEQLLRVMAAALERTQVDDSGEATMILEKWVNLDGTKVERDASA